MEGQSYLLPKVKLTPGKYSKLFWLFAMCAMWLLLKLVDTGVDNLRCLPPGYLFRHGP